MVLADVLLRSLNIIVGTSGIHTLEAETILRVPCDDTVNYHLVEEYLLSK